MKLILACIAVVLLASNVELGKMKKKKDCDSIEDALQEYLDGLDAPKKDCGLQLGNEDIKLGEEVCPAATIDLPEITFEGVSSSSYTLIMCDSGYKNEDFDIKDFPLLLAMYINISDLGDLESGDEVVPYKPPSLILGYGLKTITIFVFEQKDDIKPSSLKDYPRVSFDIAEFSSNNSLCDPVCGSSYEVQFPVNCEDCDLD